MGIRVDLHVHSRFSNQPSQWILRKMGFNESYTEPLKLYEYARQRGMTHVTITDHDTIEGAISIAHLPNTFVGEEISAFFPEDGCKVHVLAYNISVDQHNEIQRVRENIYDLTRFLNNEKIVHGVAHALYSVNNKLTAWHFEKLLLLFKNFELNGARNEILNNTLRHLFAHLNKESIDELADRHALKPLHPEPWEKNIFGGSDDHSSLNIARTYTEVSDGKDLEDLLMGIMLGASKVVSRASTPKTLAHNIYGIGWHYYKEKKSLHNKVDKDWLLTFLNKVLQNDEERNEKFISRIYRNCLRKRPWNGFSQKEPSMQGMIMEEAYKVIPRKDVKIEDKEKTLFAHASKVANNVLCRATEGLISDTNSFNIFNLFQGISFTGSLYTLLSPYLISYSMFKRDKSFCNDMLFHFFKSVPRETSPTCFKVAHFTDTLSDINGVALTLRQMARLARESKKELTIITSSETGRFSENGCKNFKPVKLYGLPEYPEFKLAIPPFMEVLDYCYRNDFTHIHISTPGTMGLCALAVAKILNLPCFATYHTAVPQYAGHLTSDNLMEDVMWQYIIWFYRQMDAVFSPSISTAEEIIKRGLPRDMIQVYPRGIDIKKFHPSWKNGFYKKHFNLNGGVKILYVGRVSKEKNLDILVQAFKMLYEKKKDVHLIVVGDGPYLYEMKDVLKETSAFFPGFMEGNDLSAIFASSDLFVFPSTTDTFGNVVLEAQASGIPVIVTDQGGPKENMLSGGTGLVVQGRNSESLANAMKDMVNNKKKRQDMGKAAHIFMQERSFEKAFGKTWDLYTKIRPSIGC